MSITSATFNHKKYHLFFEEDFDGLCDLGRSLDREMVILQPRSNTQSYLNTLIHESLHAGGIESETQVTQMAKDISRFLWRLGYKIKNVPTDK